MDNIYPLDGYWFTYYGNCSCSDKAFGAPIAALPAGSIFASDPSLSSIFAQLLKGFLILIALASAADVIKKLYRMIRG